MKFIKVYDTVGMCDCWVNVDRIETIYDKKITTDSGNRILCKESKDEIIKKIIIAETNNYSVVDGD